jgi:hypothetical protein
MAEPPQPKATPPRPPKRRLIAVRREGRRLGRWLKDKHAALLLAIIIILVGALAMALFKDKASAIAPSIVAAGVVALFTVYERFMDQVDDEPQATLLDAGVHAVYEARGHVNYGQHVAGAVDRIDVLGYSLRAFTDQHATAIAAGVARGLMVRIMIVDPAHPSALEQAQGEGYGSAGFAGNIERLQDRFGNLQNVEIKKVSTTLPEMIFRIDDTMFVGPYFSEKASGATVTFELARRGWLFDEYQAEFNLLWGRAVAV